MERNYETQGALLIKTKFGVVSAASENFSISTKEMMENKAWREAIGAETGVYCLLPEELNIPF